MVLYIQKLHEVVVKYFLGVSNFGFTRPIQDYCSGPGTRDGGSVKVLY